MTRKNSGGFSLFIMVAVITGAILVGGLITQIFSPRKSHPKPNTNAISHETGSSAGSNNGTNPDAHKPVTPTVTKAEYEVRYLDKAGKIISQEKKQGAVDSTVEVVAADLFDKGYELLDDEKKSVTLKKDTPAVVDFQYGKARELMSLREFVSHEVDYKHPIKFRNLDFTGRQKDLEDFVVKKIYQHEKDTGIFYGTKDQAEDVRKTMLNGSFQGAYARYATDMRPMIPEKVEGEDNKYALRIEFVYQESPEYIEEGEKKITEFYEKYGHLNLSDVQKAKLAQEWVIKNTKVFNPPTAEVKWFTNTVSSRHVHFPSSVMVDHEGVCLSFAMTYGRLIERLGLDGRIIQGYFGLNVPPAIVNIARKMLENPDTTTYKATYFNHTWNLVKVDGKWYHVDTYQDATLLPFTKGYEDPYHHFLQSDDFLREHQIVMGQGRRKANYTIYKAWNTNRLFPAPESRNEVKTTTPDMLEKGWDQQGK